MLNRNFTAITSALALSIGLALAVEPVATPKPAPQAAQEQVYGSQLMTKKERAAHRAKMRAAKTPEEKVKVRAELHQQMQERARQVGVTLPDTPPTGGGGMGPGPGGGRNR